MLNNPELDALQQKDQEAFQRKQAAYEKYQDAKNLVSEAYETMQSAWKERCAAKDELNREYVAIKRSSDNYRKVWEEYNKIRDANDARIESLREETSREHLAMKECFDRASEAYNYGNKSEAPIHSAEGHKHKARRNELNAEIGKLIQKKRDAKAWAEQNAPKTDSTTFRKAKEAFDLVKARYELIEKDFRRLKENRDNCKAEFDQAKEEHARTKEAFQQKLSELRAKKYK